MKKGAITLLVLVVLGAVFFCKVDSDGKAKRNAEKKAELKTTEEKNFAKSKISDMALRNSAFVDWGEALDKNLAKNPVVATIDLEKLLVSKRPILFTGALIDISSYTSTYYKLLFQNQWNATDHINSEVFDMNFQFELLCQKSRMDSFLKKYKLSTPQGMLLKDEKFAVISKITRIRSSHQTEDKSPPWSIRIGEGELIDILPTDFDHIGFSLDFKMPKRG